MFEIKIKITCSIGAGWTSSNKNNRSPNLLAERWARLWVRGSVLDLARARLDRAKSEPRGYFSRALFGLGSVQGPVRGWLTLAPAGV